mgnify:CR=1 FL=1
MNVEIIICIYFRHMQVDISKFSLNKEVHWLYKFLDCRRISAVFIFFSIYLSIYSLNAPPDGGKRLMASEQIGGA